MTPQTLELLATLGCLVASIAGAMVVLSSFSRWCSVERRPARVQRTPPETR